MYKVYVNGKMIFDNSLPSEDLVLVKPKLVLEDNKAGSFDFTLPTTHRYYNETNSFGRPFCGSKTDTITIYKNDEWFWEGRYVNESSDFYNQRVIHCEGALAYLGDTRQPLALPFVSTNLNQCVRTFLESITENHNEQLRTTGERLGIDFSDRMIYVEEGVSVITVAPSDISTFSRMTNYETTLETINKRLIDKLEGHIRVRRVTVNGVSKLVLDYLKDYPRTAPQRISFGKNLLDYSKSVDLSDIATVIIPRGDTVEEGSPFYRTEPAFANISQRVHLGWRQTTSTVDWRIPIADQRLYASSDILAEYGYVEKTVDFEDIPVKLSHGHIPAWETIEAYRNSDETITDPSDSRYEKSYLAALKILGENYLNNAQFDEIELELSVFDLSHLGVGNAQEFQLLDNVVCTSEYHGLDSKLFPLRKMEIVLNDPEDFVMTLGNSARKTISGAAGVSESIINEPKGDYR